MVVLAAEWLAVEGVPWTAASDQQSFAAQGKSVILWRLLLRYLCCVLVICICQLLCEKVKVARTRIPSVWFRSWSWFSAVSLQVMWVINPAVGCHYFLPGLQLPSQPLRVLLPLSLLGEQRHDGCKQFAYDCYATASQLRFESRPYCTWVQHANHLATGPPSCHVWNGKAYYTPCWSMGKMFFSLSDPSSL